jgi:hypothetical protein
MLAGRLESGQHSKQQMKEKSPPKFYSIGEWYGHDVTKLASDRRLELAGLSLSKKVKQLPCPFREGRLCNKAGGVCSVRQYSKDKRNGDIRLGNLVTVCPSRFFDSSELFRWVGEVMLGTETPVVLGEIPFLQKLRGANLLDSEDDDSDFIGRIDNILVHPDAGESLKWCALEMQAVYFSGMAMTHEFKDISMHPEILRFPVQKRRPDFRSSGPKRLLPQLQTKVPELTRWGKKMAICVDESFFAELVGIEEVRHLSNADLAWFVVSYEPEGDGLRLRRGRCVFAKLDSTIKALTGGIPLPQEVFEKQIKSRLGSRA